VKVIENVTIDREPMTLLLMFLVTMALSFLRYSISKNNISVELIRPKSLKVVPFDRLYMVSY